MFTVVLSAAVSLPQQASAFWPFSTNADAAMSAFVPNSSTPALHASTNIDPNPDKGLGGIQTSGNGLLADAGPSGTTADVVGTTPPDRISVYVVRPGDTLSDIADMFGVSANTVLWANNLKSSRDVHPGDTLVILPISGIERVIVKGDTLKSLAKKYDADADDIAQYNGLDPAAVLVVGSTVIIPGGEISAPPTPVPAKRPTRTTSNGGPVLTGYYSNPVPGLRITQGLHGRNGIDFGGPGAHGTPIHAAADGVIIIARNGGWNGGYGNYVVISHSNGTQTLYAHMSNTIASPGQSVSSGQVIGYVGSTGKSTGNHLHFEVRGAANPFRNCSVGAVCEPQ